MSENEVIKRIRYRVNISRGMKGNISYEATVDGENFTRDHILSESDKLVAALNERYPVIKE